MNHCKDCSFYLSLDREELPDETTNCSFVDNSWNPKGFKVNNEKVSWKVGGYDNRGTLWFPPMFGCINWKGKKEKSDGK